MENLPLWVRKMLANGVHLFTATGAVWGFLTLLAIWDGNIRLAIVYVIIAMFVDGFDGILARWLDVKTYATWIDGGLMDNIIDFVTYVVVASLLLIRVPGLMPQGLEMVAALSILLTSAFQFSQVEAKTDSTQSYFFKGFPSVWNFIVLYMMLLGLNPWINFTALMICNVLVFVPIRFLYPTRNNRFRGFTYMFTYLYGALGVWGLLQYPDIPKWVAPVSGLYVIYYLVMSLFPKLGAPKTA
jgi:phosphatidylcholine synthase